MNLEEYRKEIDVIDNKIIKLLEKRMDIVKMIGEYKKINNIEVLNYNREKEIIERLNLLCKIEYKNDIIKIFNNIMDVSKGYQNEIINK